MNSKIEAAKLWWYSLDGTEQCKMKDNYGEMDLLDIHYYEVIQHEERHGKEHTPISTEETIEKETIPQMIERYHRAYLAHDEHFCTSNDVQDLKESYYYKGRRDQVIAFEYKLLAYEKQNKILTEALEKIVSESTNLDDGIKRNSAGDKQISRLYTIAYKALKV